VKPLLLVFSESHLKKDNDGVISLHDAYASNAPPYLQYAMTFSTTTKKRTYYFKASKGIVPHLQDKNERLTLNCFVAEKSF
jgi:hypothetical protein